MRPIQGFTVAFAKAVQQNLGFFMGQKGSVVLRVGREDALTIRFGDAERPIEEGEMDKPDLLVWFSDYAFELYLDGKLDMEKALKAEEVIVGGNVELLMTLSMAMKPVRSMLSIRAG